MYARGELGGDDEGEDEGDCDVWAWIYAGRIGAAGSKIDPAGDRDDREWREEIELTSEYDDSLVWSTRSR